MVTPFLCRNTSSKSCKEGQKDTEGDSSQLRACSTASISVLCRKQVKVVHTSPRESSLPRVPPSQGVLCTGLVLRELQAMGKGRAAPRAGKGSNSHPDRGY